MEYDTIAQVVEAVSIPVLANGDISTPEKAQFVLQHTGAAAVMIGRAAQGSPWVFKQINHYLEIGTFLPPPRLDEAGAIMMRHLIALHDFYGEVGGTLISRKHIGWYINPMVGGKLFTQQFNKLESTMEQQASLRQFFESAQYQEQAE